MLVRGARENNLRAVDVAIPKGCITVFCGVSGSGKSSLAFDTLAAEGRRRARLVVEPAAALGRPARVDALSGLPLTVGLPQRARQEDAGSTVASVAGVLEPLRQLVASTGVAHCPTCDRAIVPSSHDEVVAAILSRFGGQRVHVEAALRSVGDDAVLLAEEAGFSRLRVGDDVVRIDEWVPHDASRTAPVRIVVDRLRVEPDRHARLHDAVRIAARVSNGTIDVVGEDGQSRWVDRPTCVFDGTTLPRLQAPRLTWPPDDNTWTSRVRWHEHTFATWGHMSANDMRPLLVEAQQNGAEQPLLDALVASLETMQALGLGALRLSESVGRVSSSELARLRLVRRLSPSLSGVLFVLDEPDVGLDDAQVERLLAVLRRRTAGGDTVVVVSHHPVMWHGADRIVEFGPGAASCGGTIVFEGTPTELMKMDTVTSRWFRNERTLPASEPRDRGTLFATVGPGWLHGRSSPEVRLPLGGVVGVTGASGCGKSTLLMAAATAVEHGNFAGFTNVVRADSVVGRSSRGTLATYLGAWVVLRDLLAGTRDARIQNFGSSSFSFNVKGGRCEACKGKGTVVVDEGPWTSLPQTCGVCDGRRFAADVCDVRWKGLSAPDLLALSIAEARVFFAAQPKLNVLFQAAEELGLASLTLGHPLDGLSGGEAHRLFLARAMARSRFKQATDTVFMLDDVDRGLHPEDLRTVLDRCRSLASEGFPVWVSARNRAFVEALDVVVDLDDLMR